VHRSAKGCYEAVIGLTDNTSGDISYWIDDDLEELSEWFRELA